MPDSDRVANAFGYTTEQLQSISDEAHMGLSCGNPVVTASIKEVRDQHSPFVANVTTELLYIHRERPWLISAPVGA